MLLANTAASWDSASSQSASGSAPASRSSRLSGTPVHSLVLVRPCTFWAVSVGTGGNQALALLPEHSME